MDYAKKPALHIVQDGSTGDFRKCRSVTCGQGINLPPSYPGCLGFYGWDDVNRMSDGSLVCTFAAGYWHGSFPTPFDIKAELLEAWGVDFSKVDAPTGGRTLLARSADEGKTWSQPVTLVDTPLDDLHPVLIELPSGRILCVFFVHDNWYGYDAPPPGRGMNSRVMSTVSDDGGQSWSEPEFMRSPFAFYERMRTKPILLSTGETLVATYGTDAWEGAPLSGAIHVTEDGIHWRLRSVWGSPEGDVDEPAIVEATDGSVLAVTRPRGDYYRSYDQGRTWTALGSAGIPMIAPCLLRLKSGRLVCIFGRMTGVKPNELQLIFSDDNGVTWVAPKADEGFCFENTAYLYSNACELADGSLYVTYYHPITLDQRDTAVMGIRLRIRGDMRGIDILPTGGPVWVPKVHAQVSTGASLDSDAAKEG